MTRKPDHLYRSGVGIMVINKDKEIFVGKRIDNNSDVWQMPQGGIDIGEDETNAMYRELQEETGINQVKLLTSSKDYLYYNLPYRLQKKFWGGRYLGQKQRWYLVDFLGIDKEINVATTEPEFSDWKWVNKEELIDSIVSFKRPLYIDVVREFQDLL